MGCRRLYVYTYSSSLFQYMSKWQDSDKLQKTAILQLVMLLDCNSDDIYAFSGMIDKCAAQVDLELATVFLFKCAQRAESRKSAKTKLGNITKR